MLHRHFTVRHTRFEQSQIAGLDLRCAQPETDIETLKPLLTTIP